MIFLVSLNFDKILETWKKDSEQLIDSWQRKRETMSYEYDPRELGRKGRDQPSSGNISELEQALGTEDSQQILFDFSPEESSDKDRNQDEELDIWKMIPGIDCFKISFLPKKKLETL